MKYIYFFVSVMLALTFGACNNGEDDMIMPSSITNLTAEPCEGGIVLNWDVPADSCLSYVRVSYMNPRTGQYIRKNSSVYQDTLLIDGLLAKDGEYTFEVVPVSSTETCGTALTISAKALPVQPIVTPLSDMLALTAENLYCNNPDPEEGKDIGFLVDGNTNNFFHTNWHDTGTEPHYIDFTLPNPVDFFEIKSFYRGGRFGQCPIEITVLGSNDDGVTWETIAEIEDDGSGGSSFLTPVLGVEGKTYSMVRYRADRTSNDAVFFALAEMEFYAVSFEIYDPEGIYVPED